MDSARLEAIKSTKHSASPVRERNVVDIVLSRCSLRLLLTLVCANELRLQCQKLVADAAISVSKMQATPRHTLRGGIVTDMVSDTSLLGILIPYINCLTDSPTGREATMTESNLHLNATIGCVFAGTLFATLFYGCTCGQGLYYVSEYPDDQKMVKALVLILWGLDTTTTVTDSMLMWDYVVRGHQTPATLATMPAIGSLHHLFSGTTIYIVQMYYVFTIWKLMYSKWWRGVLTGFLSILSLTTYGLAIVIVYLSLHDPTIDGVYTMTRLESIVQPTISCVTDVCITISLSLLLRSRRIRATVMTDTLLRKLMVYAINRGVLTALVQSLQVILYASSSTSVFWWALFYFPGCKGPVHDSASKIYLTLA
ncbi:hypothetical protein DAEQUDRAFT_701087 [Daedalea quercina L-15889]|uniref:DUF6534 domain-containing protein n=1 Tax=Daedalea quercina L-15889 TaxID=1314783 RepID=A0A165UHN7_9APHY|nr:hypothetical protein DAEQUDRAFT_701087 [Daedalea quercina L-15889]